MLRKAPLTMLCIIIAISIISCNDVETDNSKETTPDENLSETEIVAREIASVYEDYDLSEINEGNPVTIKVHLGDMMPTLSEIPNAEQPDVFNSTRILKRAFEIIYPNVTVEWARTVDTSSADNFLQYITTQLNSNTAPDIVFAWGSSFAFRNWYYDFTDVLEQPNYFVSDNEKWRDQFPEYIFHSWQVSDAKDRIVALPLNLSPGTPTALYFNEAILEELEINAPRSWEELFNTSNSIREKGYVSYSPWGGPGAGNRRVNTGIWDVQFSLGPFYAARQSDKLDYNNDGFQSQSEVFRAAYEGHYFLSNNEYAKDMWYQVKRKYNDIFEQGYENTDYETKWILGQVALLEDGLWRYPAEKSNTDRNFEFSMIPLPAIDRDTTDFVNELEFTENGPYRPIPNQTFNILYPSAQAHGGEGNIEACVAFLKFLTVPDNNNMIVTEQKGKSLSFIRGTSVPSQLSEYFNQEFPKVPSFNWPGGFTSEGSQKMSAILEMWVKDRISDDEFYEQFDEEFKKDIIDFEELIGIDTSTYNKGFD